MSSAFEQLFGHADQSLDEQFAEPLIYRGEGRTINLRGTLIPDSAESDTDRDLGESWLNVAIELHAADLVLNGQALEPNGGHEVAKPLAGGRLKVYLLVKGPRGYFSESVDVEEKRIVVFGRFARIE